MQFYLDCVAIETSITFFLTTTTTTNDYIVVLEMRIQMNLHLYFALFYI